MDSFLHNKNNYKGRKKQSKKKKVQQCLKLENINVERNANMQKAGVGK